MQYNLFCAHAALRTELLHSTLQTHGSLHNVAKIRLWHVSAMYFNDLRANIFHPNISPIFRNPPTYYLGTVAPRIPHDRLLLLIYRLSSTKQLPILSCLSYVLPIARRNNALVLHLQIDDV